MKAMILAAGRGERMMPLTAHTPKPLLTIGDKALIEYHLMALQRAGVQEVVINVCYLANKIMATLGDGQRYGLSIRYAVEHEQLLGTGGGVQNALPFLGDHPFILLSADIWTDYPLHRLMRHDLGSDDIHLVMVPNPVFNTRGDYAVAEQRLTTTGTCLTYANIGLIHPRLFKDEKRRIFPLADLFLQAIHKRRAGGEVYHGMWNNIGTPALLKALRAAHPSNVGLN